MTFPPLKNLVNFNYLCFSSQSIAKRYIWAIFNSIAMPKISEQRLKYLLCICILNLNIFVLLVSSLCSVILNINNKNKECKLFLDYFQLFLNKKKGASQLLLFINFYLLTYEDAKFCEITFIFVPTLFCDCHNICIFYRHLHGSFISGCICYNQAFFN